MKKLFLIALSIILYNLSDAQINMNSNGNVGIGGSPSGSNRLYINGNSKIKGQVLIYSDLQFPTSNYFQFGGQGYYGLLSLAPSANGLGWVGISSRALGEVWSYYYRTPSDARQKENIRDIDKALDIVLQLKGIKYDLKKEYAYIDSFIKDEEIRAIFEAERKNKIGFIAQDVNKILPEVVIYDDSTDIYGIDYTKVVPVLVEAIKEQNSHIEVLQAEIEQLKIGDSRSKSTVENDLDNAQLFQNKPNPFYENTVIDYYIPDGNQKATVYVYDLNGSQKKAYDVTTEGRSKIIINGSELQPGMYIYTLIVGGKEVDTKRMILTD
jgi:hypothetical protein